MVPSLLEALEGCHLALGTTARARKDHKTLYSAHEACLNYLLPQDQLDDKTLALVFEPEDWGLANEDLDLCQGYIQIPTADYASLNLAQAVQVLAYEAFYAMQELETKQPRSQVQESSLYPAKLEIAKMRLLPGELMERMYAQLEEVVMLIDYSTAERLPSSMRRLRRIFDRGGLSVHEVAALRGLWRQVGWATRDELKERLRGKLEQINKDSP
ncbi:MAG: TrmH family RNA methyltransferase [Deinococcales bacterium]